MWNTNIDIKLSNNRSTTFDCDLQSMNSWVGTDHVTLLVAILAST